MVTKSSPGHSMPPAPVMIIVPVAVAVAPWAEENLRCGVNIRKGSEENAVVCEGIIELPILGRSNTANIWSCLKDFRLIVPCLGQQYNDPCCVRWGSMLPLLSSGSNMFKYLFSPVLFWRRSPSLLLFFQLGASTSHLLKPFHNLSVMFLEWFSPRVSALVFAEMGTWCGSQPFLMVLVKFARHVNTSSHPGS